MGAGLTINDIDRTSRAAPRPKWSRAVGQRGSSQFSIVVPLENYEPLIGQQVVWFDAATRVWSGTIDTRKRRKLKRQHVTPAGIVYDCVANSLEQRLDKRYITKTVTNQDAGTIVSNLLGNELGAEGVSAGTISTGANIDILVWDNARASDVLTQLADLSGYSWYVDPDNFLQFGPPSDSPAPWTLTDPDILWPSEQTTGSGAVLSQVRSEYRNRQHIRVLSLSPPEREIFVGDGSTTGFAARRDIKQILSVVLTTSTRAQQVGTFSGVPADGDTISIGSFTYRFKTTINNRNPFEIKIGATATINAEHFMRAVNDNLDEKGTIYTWPTIANFDVDVEQALGVVTIQWKFTGSSGNLGGFVPLSKTGSAFSWAGSDIDGGVDGADNALTFGIDGQGGDNTVVYTSGAPAVNLIAAPEVGQFVVVEYRPIGFDVITVQDDAAVADRASVEGGSGVYETIESRTDLTDFNSALTAGIARLDAFATLAEDLQFSTKRGGLEPGQILTVLSSKLGISTSTPSGLIGVPYLIESVDAEFVGLNTAAHQYWKYSVKAVVTRRSNWLRAWEKLTYVPKAPPIGAGVTPPEGQVTFGLDDDSVTQGPSSDGTNAVGKYGTVLSSGAPYLGSLSCVTQPAAMTPIILDVLYSRDNGSTWTSIFPGGSPATYASTDVSPLILTSFAPSISFLVGDLLSIDVLGGGGATGITLQIRWK